jgi:hypothetical protein
MGNSEIKGQMTFMKNLNRLSIIICAIFSISIIAFSKPQKRLINQENLIKHVSMLASDSFEGRGSGYRGEREATKYIANQFKKFGLIPFGDNKTYFQTFTFHPRKPEKLFQMSSSRNVIGFIEGTDARLKNEIIVIGAHHDGQGKIGQADGGRYFHKDKNLNDEIWNSADDNASSVAVLLEIARAIRENKIPHARSILFITFGAEEHGLNGSIFYVTHPVFQWKRHSAMLNLEKLGRIPDGIPITASAGTSPIWSKLLLQTNEKTGLKVESLVPEIISDTDHYPFAARKIPAMVIGLAHEEDTHLPTDSADKILFDKLTERANYILELFLGLANTKEKMPFTGDLSKDVGMVTVLASAEEIKALKLDSKQGGLKVSSVIQNSPASKASLRGGDVILSVDGNIIGASNKREDIIREGFAEKGVLTIKVIRNGKTFELKLK